MRLCLCEHGLLSATHQVVGGTEEVGGSQDPSRYHAIDNYNEYKKQPRTSMSYYTPGPKADFLVAKRDMLIRPFRGHITPSVRARMYAAEKFLLNETQFGAIHRVSCPVIITPPPLGLNWSRVL